VPDFRCGAGAQSQLCAQNGAKSVVGIDLSSERIHRAKSLALSGLRVDFVLAGRSDCIPMPDRSVDVLLCFDVVEHMIDYRAIVREWWRMLCPGGYVLIWWTVWRRPYVYLAEDLRTVGLPGSRNISQATAA
jgi:2-polyprenyl-6-hydroxyphenyl methylase/3-demethylubiquinone-9 3-methyltransferase